MLRDCLFNWLPTSPVRHLIQPSLRFYPRPVFDQVMRAQRAIFRNLGNSSTLRANFSKTVSPRPGRGGRFCPLVFSWISSKLVAWLLRVFQYLPKNEWLIFWKNWLVTFGVMGVLSQKRSAQPLWCASCRDVQALVLVICRCRETKRRSKTGEAACESFYQYAPNPCITF